MKIKMRVKRVRYRRVYDRPSQAEVDKHNETHIPFRNWCEICVRGRAENYPAQEIGKRRERSSVSSYGHMLYEVKGGDEE